MAGLRSPTLFVHSPDGTGRRFIAEQVGNVFIINPDDSMIPEPFLNMTEIVEALGERGFLSLAFHPDYATNRRLYVYYSLQIADDMYTRLSELLADESNPNLVDRGSERILMDIHQPFENHKGGDVSLPLPVVVYNCYCYCYSGVSRCFTKNESRLFYDTCYDD